MRGHQIKTLAYRQLGNSSLRLIGQRFLAFKDKLVLQDVSAAQTSLKIFSKEEEFNDQSYNISFDHSANQVAYFSENTGVVYFEQLPTTTVLPAQTTTIRGSNNEGLNLQRVIVSNCDKLSEKNIMKF